jgi:hypothetical protein
MTDKYEAAINEWERLAIEQLQAVFRASVRDLVYSTVVNTPVHTGFLRGNWQPGLNGPPPPKPDATKDPAGARAIATAAATIKGLKLGDVFYFSNGARYARRVNYGFVGTDSLGRHYNQQGRFYLERSLAKWPAIVTANAAKLGKEVTGT